MSQVPSTSDLLKEFEVAEHKLRFAQSKIGASLMLVLIPAGLTLDFFVYPQAWHMFAFYRLAADVVVAAALALHWHLISRAYPSALIAVWLGAAILMICYMIYSIDGSRSTYYAGLVLVLLAIGILLPLRVRDAAGLSCLVLVLYTAACVAPGSAPFYPPLFFNNMYFLLLAIIICLTAVYYAHRRRFEDFLLRKELETRNQQLSELDQMKSRFFANVSHELRTPLTLILAPIQDLLSRKDLKREAREALTMVQRSAMRLLRLVNDLLDLVRFEQSSFELECRPVELGLLLGGIVNQTRYLADSQKLMMHVKLPEQAIMVFGDETALERIFINLISNAIKFTDPGGRIDVWVHEHDGRAVAIIKDSGIGLAPQDVDKIFDRFQQINNSGSRRHQGLGIGLALVKELVSKHDGSINVSTAPGEGTQMEVILPLASQQQLRQKPKSTTENVDHPIANLHRLAMLDGAVDLPISEHTNSKEVVKSAFDKPTVLVVDDEVEIQRYLNSLLCKEFNVIQAFDGVAALGKIESNLPDLVLLDLMLPKVDGLEVCRRIKQNPLTRSVKVVLLTARVDEDAKIAALSCGVDDFLTKPFSSLEIVTRLKNLEKAARLEAEVRTQNVELKETLERLQKAEAQLLHREKLNALGTMAAGLLHEINNPLNYAGMALDLARKKTACESDKDLEELLGDVDEGVRRVKTIVSDLRAFATPRAFQGHKPFKIANLIKHALRFTASELSAHTVTVDVPEDLVAIGSEQQLTQVVVNLLLNASRACNSVSDRRQGHIKILAHSNGNRVIVTVHDNGSGVPKEKLSRIFDPFFTSNEVGEGLGLGLSVSHTIIQNHEGTIDVETEEERGTSFSFDIKLHEAVQTKERPNVSIN